MKTRFAGAVFFAALLAGMFVLCLLPPAVAQAAKPASRLAVVWTSGDPEVAHRMCLMYSHAAKTAGWFGEVRLVVWGPSARLLAADKDLQAKVAAMQKDGVVVEACVVCADSYGVTARLRELGLEVKPMGPPLTELLKADWKVLTF
ncbi:MAG: DsrE family protein [Limisphaerales bacterium]